jgi:hypothetical protein
MKVSVRCTGEIYCSADDPSCSLTPGNQLHITAEFSFLKKLFCHTSAIKWDGRLALNLLSSSKTM